MIASIRLFTVALFALLAGKEAAAQTVDPCDTIAITSLRIFPAPDAPVIEDGVILIKGGKLERVGSRAQVPVPDGYCSIDQPGSSALSGFWNSHVHLTTQVLLNAAVQSDQAIEDELRNAFTRWGFTTIFDLGSTASVANEIRGRIDAGRITGPRILSVGDLFYPPRGTPVYAQPFYDQFDIPSAEIASLEKGVERAVMQLQGGMDGVKLFTGSITGGDPEITYMAADTVRAIAEATHRHDKPVFAHPTDRSGLEIAVSNGVDVLAHAAPLAGPWHADYASWIAANKVALIPTLALFADAANPRTPVTVAVQQMRALHDAGGRILFGTDAGFTDDFDPASEFQLMHSAMGWPALLASLTTAPAAQFGESDQRGQLAEGFSADIVIVQGNPSEDLESLSKVVAVIREGKILYLEID